MNIFEAARKAVVENTHRYENTGELKATPWFSNSRAKVNSTDLARVRRDVLSMEVYVQCVGHYLRLIFDKQYLTFDVNSSIKFNFSFDLNAGLPNKKGGDNAAFRAAASHLTLGCNEEFVIFALLKRDQYPLIYDHINATELSTRYILSDRDPTPFLQYHRVVMERIGFWSITKKDDGEYHCQEGPCLLPFMEQLYWPVRDAAELTADTMLTSAKPLSHVRGALPNLRIKFKSDHPVTPRSDSL